MEKYDAIIDLDNKGNEEKATSKLVKPEETVMPKKVKRSLKKKALAAILATVMAASSVVTFVVNGKLMKIDRINNTKYIYI